MMKTVVFSVLALGAIGFLGCQQREKTPPPGRLDTVLTVRYFGADGKTALELLEAGHRVEKKSSSIGSFVESIDGIKNSRDQFWLYYVNGKKPDVASDRYPTRAGDTIEWKFEKEY
jgi:hypothetical protein